MTVRYHMNGTGTHARHQALHKALLLSVSMLPWHFWCRLSPIDKMSFFCMACISHDLHSLGLAKPCLCTGPCSATTVERCTSQTWRTSTTYMSTIFRVQATARGATLAQQISNERASTGCDERKTQNGKQKPDSIGLYHDLSWIEDLELPAPLVLNENPLKAF